MSVDSTSSAFQITIRISYLRGGIEVMFISGYFLSISASDRMLISSFSPSGLFMIERLVGAF